jgi:hypothetical protein
VIDQILLLLILSIFILKIFGYSLFWPKSKQVGGLCLTFLLRFTLAIFKPKGVASLEFRLLMLVGTATLISPVMGLSYKREKQKI